LRKQANHTIARNVLDSELGKFADTQPTYRLDQETRDRLLVRARQDAAEALCHTRSLMDEVQQLKSGLRSLTGC
jgi:HEAT repeat protein